MLYKDFYPCEKPQRHTWKNIVFFRICLISPFSCRTSLGRVYEGTAKPLLFVGIFSDYGCQNTEKSVSPIDNDAQTFEEREKNQNTKRKTKSYVYSSFGNGFSRGWERKSTTGRFVAGRFWPYIWKISSVCKDNMGKCIWLQKQQWA